MLQELQASLFINNVQRAIELYGNSGDRILEIGTSTHDHTDDVNMVAVSILFKGVEIEVVKHLNEVELDGVGCGKYENYVYHKVVIADDWDVHSLVRLFNAKIAEKPQ